MTFKQLVYFAYKYYVKNYKVGFKADYLSIPNNEILIEEGAESQVTINIGGDLMPYAMIDNAHCKNLCEEKKHFFDADIVVANLETPLDNSKKPSFVPEMMLSNMDFNSNSNQFDIFSGNSPKGFDVLSLANNHTLDMGYAGLENTVQFLEDKNIAFCGAGKTTHALIEKNGVKIAFLAYTYCLNQYLPDDSATLKINYLPLNTSQLPDIAPIIQEVDFVRKQGAEIVILMLHTGNAYQPFPGKQTVNLFKEISQKTNVDAIIGGHPHNIQPMQLFNNNNHATFACYSLGDFIAYDIYNRCHLCLDIQLQITRIKGIAKLSKVIVNANFMEYKNSQLRLRNFDQMIENNEIGNNKVLQDLEWLYLATIKSAKN